MLLLQVERAEAQADGATAEGAIPEGATPEGTGPSASRDAEARGLFEAGRAAFSDGRFEDALEYFQRSYDLSHRGELLYNIGSAADRLQQEERALTAFEEYLRELPEATNRREVEGRIRVLRQHMDREAAEALQTTVVLDGATAPVVDPLTTPGEPPRDEGPGVVGEWWFWTVIVGVVAGGVLAGVLIGTSQDTQYPPYVTGDEGTIAFTLTVPTP